MTRYKLADIALDRNGIFWVYYIGDVPEQGGIHFGSGQVGFEELEDAMAFLGANIKKHLETYKEKIGEKHEAGEV